MTIEVSGLFVLVQSCPACHRVKMISTATGEATFYSHEADQPILPEKKED